LAEKLDRKQLKQPDEFQLLANKLMKWTAEHSREVATAIIAIGVLVVGLWAFAWYRQSHEEKAGSALSQALDLASRPIAGETAPGSAEQTFPSKDERQKAVMAALQKVRADFGGSRAAETAQAELGFHELSSGDSASAVKDLQEFLNSAAKDHPLRFVAQQSLGYALESQGKLDEAKAAFDKLREMGAPATADYQDARLALVQNKPEAKAALEKVARDYPKETDLTREANERVELSGLPPYTAPASAPEAPKSEEKPAPAAKPAAKKKK
jgi:hypothetical protein